jgi:arginyl-tRNA synthetase
VDLRDEGLDEKLLLRSDGTSVYMTQDIGTAFLRYEDFSAQKMIYVVGNEQNYHFDVLKLILTKKLNTAFGNSIFHLSYGMVELPEGKMKSREGTVVDADDLIEEMILQARKSSEALGKNDFTDEEAEKLYRLIGLGALKYFILKVDPKKNMLFNPNESIDLNGNTAPFIQYSYARIASLLRKAEALNINYLAKPDSIVTISKNEKELIKSLNEFPKVIENAGEQLNPAIIANYLFELAKDFNRFYQETPILKEPEVEKQKIYLQMSKLTSITLKNGMALLGIEVPEKM